VESEQFMHWASSISTSEEVDAALAQCEQYIRAQMGDDEPDLVLVFASMGFHRQVGSLGAEVTRLFPSATVIGCTGAGVIGGGKEVELAEAISITAASLPGVNISAFHLNANDLPSPDDPPNAWEGVVGASPDAEPHFILLADPFSINAEDLLAGLDFAFPPAAKIGGLASGGSQPGSHGLYLGETAFREGAVGVALTGNVVVDTVVAQGCRPIGEPMRVTSAESNMLRSADDKPPIELLQELFERSSARDQDLMQRNLFMGVAMDPLMDDAKAGDFLIRNIVGADQARGGIAVGTHLREGQMVQFHVRDADTSAEDLKGALARYLEGVGDRNAAAALMFQCTGRGRYLYGEEGHDTSVFNEMVGALPLGGFFCNGEIGPVGGATYLHGYTSSFAIFRERTVGD
jgi:small ligand-binding sensory domain FIST